MLSDKDITNTLAPLIDLKLIHGILVRLNVARGCMRKQHCERCNIDTSKLIALTMSLRHLEWQIRMRKQLILFLVFGSFYTVAEIRRLLS